MTLDGTKTQQFGFERDLIDTVRFFSWPLYSLWLAWFVFWPNRPLPAQQPVYQDTVFDQERRLFFQAPEALSLNLRAVECDRNGVIQCLSNGMLLKPAEGLLKRDHRYRFMNDLMIRDLVIGQEQFIYLTPEVVFSNAWAGKLHFDHRVADAKYFAAGTDFDFLVCSDDQMSYFKNGEHQQTLDFDVVEHVREVCYDSITQAFWIVTSAGLQQYDVNTGSRKKLAGGLDIRDLALGGEGTIYLATSQGLITLDPTSGEIVDINRSLPTDDLACVTIIEDRLWMGSAVGAFSVHLENHDDINYYASRRWLPSDEVIDIKSGHNRQVLILTSIGLSVLDFAPISLYSKALHFENQVRQRHIRHGFNCAEFVLSRPEDLSSGYMVDSDNDGLWTSMYLASQIFRYAVTKSQRAYRNAIEAFEAMERLNSINPIKGFLARSYERSSYALHDLSAWHRAADSIWDWKGTTSSDEAIGHYFAFSLVAELLPDPEIRRRAISLIVDMTDHIIENDLYLVDIDGKPTRWARWNPDYVNGFPQGVGDRKLNSSNIIGFLQTAFHFTKHEKYRREADRLMEEHGYLTNLMKPMEEIGVRTDDSLSAMLSSSWNHSDDEMYFLSYWNLYPYAFTPALKEKYRQTIKNHWNIERPEKDGLWNLCYAMTGAEDFDLDETIWYLQEFPLDLIDYTIRNSHRKDITLLPDNFRRQTTAEVLPPDERPVYKHNTNTFVIDRNRGGLREASGDIYLLPYWMGRYLGVISGPVDH